MNDLEKILIALFFLAIVAVVVGSGQASSFIQASGQFLVSMVQKINGTGQIS